MSLRFVLLALLSKEPNTGYGVGRLLRGQLNHMWDARLQQIYSELAKLKDDGLTTCESIELRSRPARKIYSLTPAGASELDRWLQEAPAPVFSKDGLLVRLYCLDRLPIGVTIHRLQERRDEYDSLARELHEKLSRAHNSGTVELGHALTLEAALSEAEARAMWCKSVIARLSHADDNASEPADEQISSPLKRASSA